MSAVEEPTVVAEATVVAAPADPVVEEKAAEKGGKKKKAAPKAPKEPKAKKPAGSRKPKAPSAHPSYYEMVRDAITTLKERTGSSQFAITKFIEQKHKAALPGNFKKVLLGRN